VRLAFGGVAATPLRAGDAEDALEATEFAPSDVERARETLRRTLRPIDDHRGSAAYRVAMAQSLIDKFRYEEMA
jgi:xanthine dehydrogenase small subunit